MSDAQWRKSTHSGNQGDCVEVAPASEEVRVRDTKDREGGQLSVTGGAWKVFLGSLGRL
jgi:hypothetical protein